ncbi:MAG: molybdopterin/thiamine biosynthesis adenylyltransferase [Oceanicoccus sp.]|jgi:molybdopterin/thiamine biosynthesis adenylyltransferase
MNDQELERYSRHLLLPQLDYDGQQALLNSHVLILGLGGLGASASQYLAGSGIGRLTLLDPDTVELSNLHRQVVHSENTLNMNKAQSAQQQLQQLNSSITIEAIDHLLDDNQLLALINSVDVVVDCTDNSASRMMHNKICIQTKTPLVSAAAIRFEGQLMVVDPREDNAPCYQCVYPDLSGQQDTCSQSGILSPVVGLMGVMQALETVKLISKIGSPSIGKLVSFDALDLSMRSFSVSKNINCPVCSQKK